MLAQGAGVALEDAFFLAQSIKEFNDDGNRKGCVKNAPVTESSVGRTGRQVGDQRGLHEVLSRYDSERLQRYVAEVKQMTDFLLGSLLGRLLDRLHIACLGRLFRSLE